VSHQTLGSIQAMTSAAEILGSVRGLALGGGPTRAVGSLSNATCQSPGLAGRLPCTFETGPYLRLCLAVH
jgi:hypothetical protein